MIAKKIVVAIALVQQSRLCCQCFCGLFGHWQSIKKHRILTSLCLLTMLALLVGCTNTPSLPQEQFVEPTPLAKQNFKRF